ncbi:MAG: hypothetical protein QW284_00020 [Ignisphaera sp.]
MARLRICYLLKLEGGGLWGSGKGLLEANVVTTACRHARGGEVLCIPHTYIKGVLRRAAEEVFDHLTRVGIVQSRDIILKVFGPLTPFSDKVAVVPSPTMFGPLYPVKDVESAKALANDEPMAYLFKDSTLLSPSTYIEPHVRLDDRCARAAKGALFKELRVAPATLFYGEIMYESADFSELTDVARLLTIAIAMLRYKYVGRRSSAKSYILKIEPPDIAEDENVKYVLSVTQVS